MVFRLGDSYWLCAVAVTFGQIVLIAYSCADSVNSREVAAAWLQLDLAALPL